MPDFIHSKLKFRAEFQGTKSITKFFEPCLQRISMDIWLKGFAYKITIAYWVFAISLLVVLAIALATVSLQTVKAALENPVKSLKTD